MGNDKSGYEVGYGKPPKHSRFVPGESGNKGRRKKVLETHTAIMARVRDEIVTVGDTKMTAFELAVRSVFKNTIKSGRASDLKKLFDLLDKYGAMSEADKYADMKRDADIVMERINFHLSRTFDRDPELEKRIAAQSREETELILTCECCGPALRKEWNTPERKRIAKDGYRTQLQSAAEIIHRDKVGGTYIL